jgi:predicted transcriptional regulator
MTELEKAQRRLDSYDAMLSNRAGIDKMLKALKHDRLTIYQALAKLKGYGVITEHANAFVLEAIRFKP